MPEQRSGRPLNPHSRGSGNLAVSEAYGFRLFARLRGGTGGMTISEVGTTFRQLASCFLVTAGTAVRLTLEVRRAYGLELVNDRRKEQNKIMAAILERLQRGTLDRDREPAVKRATTDMPPERNAGFLPSPGLRPARATWEATRSNST